MEAAPPPRRLLRLALCLLAGLAAAALVWTATERVGPRIGVAGDPPVYTQASVHLAQGIGYETCTMKPVIAYQIFYPAALAVAERSGLSLIDSVRVVSLLSFAALVLATGLALWRALASTAFYALALLTVLAWPELLVWQLKALTDAPFAASVMVFLGLIAGFGRTGGRGWLIAAAVAAAASTMVRYIGVVTIPIGLAAVLLAPGRFEVRQRFGDLVRFGVIAGTPLALFMARNWLASGTLTGPRPRAATPILEHLQLMADQLSAWFLYLPGLAPELRIVALAAAAGLAALALLVLALRVPRRDADRLALVCLAFVVLYLGTLGFLRSRVQFDDVSGRFVLPAAIPALVFLAVALDRVVAVLPGRWGRRAGLAIALAWLAWLYVPAKNLAGLVLDTAPPDHDRAASRELRQSAFLQTALARRDAGVRLVAIDPESANFLFIHLEQCPLVADLRPGHDRGLAPGDLVVEIHHPDLVAGPDQDLSREALAAAGLETVYAGRFGRLHQPAARP